MASGAEDRVDGAAAVAQGFGPVVAGSYRVVIFEADARIRWADHASFELARGHADDAASETESGVVVAVVVNDHFEIVHRGQHYASA